MSARGRVTVIDLDHERLSFVSGDVGPRRVRVEASGSVARPSSIDAAKPEQLGAWVGERLRAGGVPAGGKILLCVPRGNVVMKRLAFPGLESLSDPDLVAMVRLQMTRQMPMKVEGTAIDFVPLGRVESEACAGREGGSGSGSGSAGEESAFEVLACALPGDRVAWCRGVAEAAGVKLGALSLRASGAATLLAQHPQAATGTVLGISIAWSCVEFVVVRDGEIVFVRSADLALSEGVDAGVYADRVAVEAKRTWMAYRVSPGSSEVSSVMVVGEGVLAGEVAKRCGRSLDLSASAAALPGFVEMRAASVEGAGSGDGPAGDAIASVGPAEGESDQPEQAGGMTPAQAVALAPLVGLMVAHASDRPVFDFAHPRRPPDVAAGARRMVLLGVLGAIVVVGGGLVLAGMRVAEVQSRARVAEAEARRWGARVVEQMRVDARLKHAEQWLAADVDWLAHWSKISDTMPLPPDALLDSLGGSLARAEVGFEPGGSGSSQTYANSRWNLRLQAVLHATGRISSRVVGNEFRERLVLDPNYVVESRGADTENSFDMDLVTTTLEPAPVPPVGPGALGASTQPEREPVTGPAVEGGEPARARQTASSATHTSPGTGGAP